MLSFPTQSVSAGAVQVQGMLDPDDKAWLEGDTRPNGPGVEVAGRISEAGSGRYYFSGSIAGEVTQECGRCLSVCSAAVAAEVHVLFADGAHEDESDPDVFPLVQGRSGSEVDVRRAVREGWLLEVPVVAVCSPECRGLCPTCGTNLNQGPCTCARKPEE